MVKRKRHLLQPPLLTHAKVLGEFITKRFKSSKDTGWRARKPTREHRAYANLSRQAYQDPDERSKGLRMYGAKQRYVYRRDLSTEEEAVYVSDDEFVVAFRGTKVFKDVLTDADLALGNLDKSERAQASLRRFDDILKQSGNRKVIVTGHSLGGALAKHVGDQYKDEIDEIHMFNPGGRVQQYDGLKRHTPDTPDPRVHGHYIEGDPISAYVRHNSPDTVHIYTQVDPNRSKHTIDNFI